MTRRVAVVKSAGRADAFVAALRSIGCVPVLVSPFREERVERYEPALAAALAAAPTWVAVTSPNAVPRLADFRSVLRGLDVAAVGPGTATALHTIDVHPVLVGTGGAVELARRILSATRVGPQTAVVHPCAEFVRPGLGETLAAAGVRLVQIPVYRMVADSVGERAAEGAFDAVVLASPRLAERAAELFPARPPAIAIGRTTAAAMRDLGWRPSMVAATPSPTDIARALLHVLGPPPPDGTSP